jgi:hypothetical protein
MNNPAAAQNLLYELWITYAEKLLERVIAAVDLTPEQVNALRRVALRPNDFIIQVEGEDEPHSD